MAERATVSIETQRIETLTKWVANRDQRISTLLAVIEECEKALRVAVCTHENFDTISAALAAIRKVKEGK